MDLFQAVVTLFLIMDPLGNVPLFLSALRAVPAERRRRVLVREIALAYLVLMGFLWAGRYVMQLLELRPETISIAGGIVLFLIALRMIFPGERGLLGDPIDQEPFLVPLAIPAARRPVDARGPAAARTIGGRTSALALAGRDDRVGSLGHHPPVVDLLLPRAA